MNVLVTAASANGATGEIAQVIGDVLAARGLLTMVIPPEQVGDVTDYDAIVLGSAVYTGHWLEPAKELVRRSGDAFAGRPVWLFSSGPVGDPTRALVQKMRADPVDLAEIRERTNAREHRMFEGRLEKDRLGLAAEARVVRVPRA